MEVETLVYFDPNYPSAWINAEKGYPQKIANAFSQRGYKVLDAPNLKKLMMNTLEKGIASQKLIVFAQDIAPALIVETTSSENTMREYLDAGGSILWIGDTPLQHKGNSAEDQTETNYRVKIGKEGGPMKILGIIPVFGIPKNSVSMTTLGRKIGLKFKWSGMRPIIQDSGIKTLAKSENIICRYYIDIENKKNILCKILQKIQGTPSIKATEPETEFDRKNRDEPTQQNLHCHETHANAWMKNFNSYYPNSGFYRIWDYPPTVLSNIQLEELITISEKIAAKMKEERQAFFMPTES